jgi:hypothetical protein
MSPKTGMMTVSKYAASDAKFSVGPLPGARVFSFVFAAYYGHAPSSTVFSDILKPLHSSSALYLFTMPAQRCTQRALPDDPREKRKNQNRENQKNCRAR